MQTIKRFDNEKNIPVLINYIKIKQVAKGKSPKQSTMCKLTGDTKLSSKRDYEIMMQCDSTRVLTKLNSIEYNTMFKT